jgi:biotin carboxylase
VRGRRLLVLGAGHYQLPVIRRAQALGIHVTTVDYVPDNPGHAIADAHAIVSTVDQAAVLQLARERAIDGVLTYGSDVSAPTVAHVAEALRLPGHPAAAVADLQRKHRFRALQREAGLPHPPFAAADSAAALRDAVTMAGAALPMPVVVKPADSSGSKGQTVVAAPAGIEAAFAAARPFSRCGIVLAETVLIGDTLELVGEAYLEEGRLVCRQFGHNYFLDGAVARVPVGELVPSLLAPAVEAAIDAQLQALADAAGLGSGCLNFDGILSNGVPYLVDIGIRNGGNHLDDLIALSTGVDFTDAAIHAALGVPFTPPPAAAPRPAISYILNARTAGIFDRVETSAAVQPLLRRLDVFVAPGDAVDVYTRGDRTLGIALLEVPDLGTAMALLADLPRHLQVHLR